jgi:hypothetical protein
VNRLALLIACAVAVACTPPPTGFVCGSDDDCARGSLCVAGDCEVQVVQDAGAPADSGFDAGAGSDAGFDAGASSDAGLDAGASSDAGFDAGASSDAGFDAGASSDAGLDAGGTVDGGTVDGGSVDAGPPAILSFPTGTLTVDYPETLTISWETRGMTSCALLPLDRAVALNETDYLIDRPGPGGLQLRCEDAVGATHTANVIVEVNCAATFTHNGNLAYIGAAALPPGWEAGSCLQVTGDVTVIGTGGSLTGLEPLYGLKHVGGNLYLGDNASLERLDGLELLVQVVGHVSIGWDGANDNDALTSVEGLHALKVVGGDLSLVENSALRHLRSWVNLVQVSGDLIVDEHGSLQTLAFSSLSSVGGDLRVKASTPSTLLLPSLEAVSGTIELFDAPDLTRVDFPSLTTLGDGLIVQATGARDVTASLLAGTPGDIHIAENSSLADLTGFDVLSSVGGELRIEGNGSMTTMSFPQLGLVHALYLSGLNSMATLAGLNQLIQVSTHLRIESNTSLTTLGLAMLTQAGTDGTCTSASKCDFVVRDHPSLPSTEATGLHDACGGSQATRATDLGNNNG